ncbi:Enteropeptidase [Holothuria leucospilota]|uniref:Enteropeptidase n=1 Tax=Holothuria leucospilota TaxID=206669 RepID=A0A9Q1CFI6_HOLLE|nr:Enteropeptidase [Holothuria leucospilota]
MSKNFPSNYPDNHRREIIFWTFDSHRVLLNFDLISTETGYDYVKVGNGNTTDEQVLLIWSGGPAENKTKVLSAGNTMWFSFKTDGSQTYKGFSGVVQAVPAESKIDCDSEFDCKNGVCIPNEYACTKYSMLCTNFFDKHGLCRGRYKKRQKESKVKSQRKTNLQQRNAKAHEDLFFSNNPSRVIRPIPFSPLTKTPTQPRPETSHTLFKL